MKYLSTKQVCERLGVDRATLKKWEDEGKIRCWRMTNAVNSHKRWFPEEVERFEAEVRRVAVSQPRPKKR